MSTNENQQAVNVVLYELEGSVKVCRKLFSPEPPHLPPAGWCGQLDGFRLVIITFELSPFIEILHANYNCDVFCNTCKFVRES